MNLDWYRKVLGDEASIDDLIRLMCEERTDWNHSNEMGIVVFKEQRETARERTSVYVCEADR